MKKSGIVSLVFCLVMLISAQAFAGNDIKHLLIKHNLSRGESHTWEILNLKEKGNDLNSYSVQLKWIETVSEGTDVYVEPIHPREYLKYSSVQKILDKNKQTFASIDTIANGYKTIIERMDDMFEKAKKVYNTRIPSRRVQKKKETILLAVKANYETLRNNSIEIYNQGVRVEGILSQLYEPILDAYSYGKLGKVVSEEFSDQYSPEKLQFDERSVDQALRETQKEMELILKESQKIFDSALENLEEI